MSLTYQLVRLLPRNLLSRTIGKLARLLLPQPLNRIAVKLYVRLSRIDLSDSEKPLEQFRTIEEVFSRRLRPGARRFEAAVCSPCDGFLTAAEELSAADLLQVKGHTYSVAELLNSNSVTSGFDPAYALSVYLSPRDYHRVHAPVTGTLTHITYVPGDLWPVNSRFLQRVPRLFLRNERLIFTISSPAIGTVPVVMVGALNVGRMTTPFAPNLITNNTSRRSAQHLEIQQPVTVGEELGAFLLGSTVLAFFDRSATSQWLFAEAGRRIRAGESIAEPRSIAKPD